MIGGKHTIGCNCCGGCNCFKYQAGNFPLDVHCKFDSHAFGVHLSATRSTTDPRLWKGWIGDSPSFGRSTKIAVRVPENGKPRILFHTDTGAIPNTVTYEEFDHIGSRPGCIWECTGGVWNLVEYNNFNYLGRTVLGESGKVDGVVSIPITSSSVFTNPPDNFWCYPSYIPDSITLRFTGWQNTASGAGVLRRSNFNGINMALPLTANLVIGTRRVFNYGSFTLPFTTVFYSDSPITCAGNPAWPQYTVRWRPRCQVIAPLNPADGTATRISVLIFEDWASTPDAGTGCFTVFSGDFGVPQLTGRYLYLSSFDQLPDDQAGITHWVKKANTAIQGGLSSPDDVTYFNTTNNFSAFSPPIGELLGVVF